jgi:hypothetical protein
MLERVPTCHASHAAADAGAAGRQAHGLPQRLAQPHAQHLLLPVDVVVAVVDVVDVAGCGSACRAGRRFVLHQLIARCVALQQAQVAKGGELRRSGRLALLAGPHPVAAAVLLDVDRAGPNLAHLLPEAAARRQLLQARAEAVCAGQPDGARAQAL